MAETQAKAYMKLRQAFPALAEKEILETMFVQRAKIALATGSKELFYQMVSDSDWVHSVVRTNPDLLSMTVYIIMCEHPELRTQDPRLATALLGAGLSQDDIFREVVKVVAEALDMHAPIWREHYAGVLDLDDGSPSKPGAHDDKAALADAKPALAVRFEAHEKRVNSVLFFPDGTRLLSCGIDGKLHVWDTSGRLIVGLRTAGPIESIALSPDASLVACSIATTVDLWDLRNTRRVASYHGHKLSVYTVGFHPAGRHVISSDEETLRIWDIGTGREVHRVSCGDDLFMAVAFSPDCRFAAVSGDRCTVRCLDLRTGDEWCSLAGHSSLVTSVAVSRDGRFLLTGSLDMTSRLWDIEGRREIRRFTGFGNPIGAVAFSPRSPVGIIAGDGLNVCLWDLNTGNSIQTLTGQRAGVVAATFSADGRRVVSGAYDGCICLWNVE
jgi:WD40 repeat protein